MAKMKKTAKAKRRNGGAEAAGVENEEIKQ
jgi:hypothetical protein